MYAGIGGVGFHGNMFTQCNRLFWTNSLIGGFTTGRQEYNTELLCNSFSYNWLNVMLFAFVFIIWHCHFCVLHAMKLWSAMRGRWWICGWTVVRNLLQHYKRVKQGFSAGWYGRTLYQLETSWPFTVHYKRALLVTIKNLQQYSIIAAPRELYVDSRLWVDKMSTDRQSGMNVAHLVLVINVIIHFDILLH